MSIQVFRTGLKTNQETRLSNAVAKQAQANKEKQRKTPGYHISYKTMHI
jgi:hypothetical protein